MKITKEIKNKKKEKRKKEYGTEIVTSLPPSSKVQTVTKVRIAHIDFLDSILA